MNEKLTQKIVEIADKLFSEGEVWCRADLASELKDYGVSSDSIAVAGYVYEAYKKTSKKSVRCSFVTNDGTSFLVDDYEIHNLADEQKSDELFEHIGNRQREAKKALYDLKAKLSDSESIISVSDGENSELLSFIKETDSFIGVTDIAECAAKGKLIFEKYSGLKSAYKNAESEVKVAAKDFVVVRQYIVEILDRQIRLLRDVFGDSVVAVAPDLFDFNRIEYLDIDSMYSRTKLEYDRLSESCPVLMDEIRKNFKDSFSHSLRIATKAFKSGNSPYAGLALAAIEMYGAHIENQNKVAVCKTQLEALKQSVNYDVSAIDADFGRLLSIYKTINDIFSPAASAFCRRSEEVLSSDIKDIYRKVYNDPLVRNIVEERKALLAERTELEIKYVDFLSNIAHYKAEISQNEFCIKEKADEYKSALQRKPEKPGLFSKIISVGNASESYAKNLLAWKETDFPVVEEYEKMKTQIHIDTEELASAEKEVSALRGKIAELNSKISALDAKIEKNISLSYEEKVVIASNLEKVVRLLKTGKQLAESKIDEESLKASKISRTNADALPTSIKTSICEFCKANGIDTSVSEETVQRIADEEGVSITKEERKAAALASGKAVATTIVLMDNYIELYKKRAAGEIELEKYKAQIASMKVRFEAKIKDIDNKADVLAGIITRINTSGNKDLLRDALIELGNSSFNLSPSDLDDIIAGKKRIEI